MKALIEEHVRFEGAVGSIMSCSILLILCAFLLHPRPSSADEGKFISGVLDQYFSGSGRAGIKKIDQYIETKKILTHEEINPLYWSLFFRLEQSIFDETTWKHVGMLQKIDDKKGLMFRWTIAQSILARSALLSGDWSGAYKHSFKCILENQAPPGDLLPFISSCLKTMIETAPLTGKVQEATTTVEAALSSIVKTNILYRTNACDLIHVFGQNSMLQGDWRKSLYAFGTYQKHHQRCIGNIPTKAAQFIQDALTLLMEIGDPEGIKNFLAEIGIDKIISSDEISISLKSKLKWTLLNAYSLTGDFEKAESVYTNAEITSLQNAVKKISSYPYVDIRAALLAFCAIISGREKDLYRYLEKMSDKASSQRDFLPAVLIIKTEKALRNKAYSDAAKTLAEFAKALFSLIEVQQQALSNKHFQLRGYNKLLVKHALDQFSQLPKKVRNTNLVNLSFQLSQALSTPEKRFGLEKSQEDIFLSKSLADQIFRSISRANEKGKDTAVWGLLNELAGIISSEKEQNKKAIDKDSIRLGSSVSRSIRQSAEFENDIRQSNVENKSSIDPLAPLKINEVQDYLHDDEALYTFQISKGNLQSFCIRKHSFSYKNWDVNAKILQQSLKLLDAALRVTGEPSQAIDKLFPIKESRYIFDSLFGLEQTCAHKASHLFLVPPQGLTLLPYNALATNSGDTLKSVKWLSDLTPLSFLTSISSLRFLRKLRGNSESPALDFLGVANPTFTPEKKKEDSEEIIVAQSLYQTRGSSNFGGFASLQPLPETESEVRAIARLFHKSKTKLIMGEQATERQIRKLELGKYRFINFASHALVAGEFEGISEPAIALAPGDPRTSRADGLLTASEINEFRLNADLVILSACNTAAGDGGFSAPGLSGLTDSVLAAGAKSVLATQWPIESKSAEHITVELMTRLIDDKIGSARALSLAFKKLQTIENGKFENPRFWAGFIIVGDGMLKGKLEDNRNRKKKNFKKAFFNTSFELKPNKPRFAEWIDLISVANNAADTISVGYSAEPPDGTENRAAGIIQRVDEEGRIVWRISSNEHGFSKIIEYNDKEFFLISNTFSAGKKTAFYISKRAISDGSEISLVKLVDTSGIDGPKQAKFVNGKIVIPFTSDAFEGDPDRLELGVVSVDPDNIENFTISRFKFKSKEMNLGRLSYIPAIHLLTHKKDLLLAVSAKLNNYSSDKSITNFAYRKYCFDYSSTLIFNVGKGISFRNEIKNIELKGVSKTEEFVAYSKNGPCSSQAGLIISRKDDFLNDRREHLKLAQIDWPVSMQVGEISNFRKNILIFGSFEVPRYFMSRPRRESDDFGDFLDEDRIDESSPKSAFMLELNKTGLVKNSFIFDDQRTRFISGAVIDQNSGTFTLNGTAAGGDSWILSGILN